MNPYQQTYPQLQNSTHNIPNMVFTVAMNQGFTPNPIQPPLFNPNMEFIIESGLSSDLVLDISQQDENYGQLIIWKKHGKRNQRFKFVQHCPGKYLIVSCFGMSLLSVNNNSAHEGSSIFLHYSLGSEGQVWQFEPVKDKPNMYYIKNGHIKYLDVFEAKSKKGTKIIQWKYHGKKNQMWRIVPAH